MKISKTLAKLKSLLKPARIEEDKYIGSLSDCEEMDRIARERESLSKHKKIQEEILQKSMDKMSRLKQIKKQIKQNPDKVAESLLEWETEISKVMPLDFKDWWQNSKEEWPLVARLSIQRLREEVDFFGDAFEASYKDFEDSNKEIIFLVSLLENFYDLVKAEDFSSVEMIALQDEVEAAIKKHKNKNLKNMLDSKDETE